MAARHAATAGFGGGIEQLALIITAKTLQMRRHLLWTQFPHQPPLLVDQTALGTEQQQLVGLKLDGGTGRDVFAGQVENFTGR
ncbi:hypothetical protein D3C78_1710120 [compost metagenome]